MLTCGVAKQIEQDKTRKAAVTLKESLAHRKRQGLVDLFGKIDYYPDYDYKRERKARPRGRSR